MYSLRTSSTRSPVAAAWALIGFALIGLVMLSALHVRAIDEARCEGAMKIQSDPAAAAFKACASGATPIPTSCCLKMAPFVQYGECLQVAKYRDMADSFLAPNVTVARALKDCLGSN